MKKIIGDNLKNGKQGTFSSYIVSVLFWGFTV